MWMTGNTLVKMESKSKKKKSRLTLDLEPETLIELKAAVVVFGAKSYSSLIHQQIVQKIREAKQLVSRDEFDQLCKQQAEEISVKSEQKRNEREKKLSALQSTESESEEMTVKKTSKPGVSRSKKNFISRNGEVYKIIDEDPLDDDND